MNGISCWTIRLRPAGSTSFVSTALERSKTPCRPLRRLRSPPGWAACQFGQDPQWRKRWARFCRGWIGRLGIAERSGMLPPNVGRRFVLETDALREHVAVGMTPRLLGRQFARVDVRLNPGVVRRELGQHAGPEEVGTRVAHVAERIALAVPIERHRRERGSPCLREARLPHRPCGSLGVPPSRIPSWPRAYEIEAPRRENYWVRGAPPESWWSGRRRCDSRHHRWGVHPSRPRPRRCRWTARAPDCPHFGSARARCH